MTANLCCLSATTNTSNTWQSPSTKTQGGEDLYIYVPVTDSRVGEFERGDVTLLEAIVGVGNTQVFYGTERGPDTAKSINAADLPDNWLPEAPASLMAKLPFSAPPPSSWSSATTPSS